MSASLAPKIARLDEDILRLKELQIQYETQAAAYEDQGLQWEVYPHRIVERALAFFKANRDRAMSEHIAARMQTLEELRNRLQEHANSTLP